MRPFVTLLLLLAGCQAHRPVLVQVRDFDTRRPIPGVEVELSPLHASGATRERTSADGVARMRADGDGGVVVTVKGEGYHQEERVVTAAELRAVPDAGLFGTSPGITLAVNVFSDATVPSVELVFPPGFAGLVRVELAVEDDAPYTPGQRRFTFPASASVRAVVPPLFRHLQLPDFRARFADGPELSSSARGDEVGFWWVRTEGNVYTYYVGPENARVKPDPDAPAAKHASGGGGRGKGGKRGRQGGTGGP